MSQAVPPDDTVLGNSGVTGGERSGEAGIQPEISPARQASEIIIRITPKRALVVAGAAVVAAGGIFAGLALTTSGSSYPHSWCASTLNYMYTSTPTGTFQDFLNELQYEENQGAATGQLLADEKQLSEDAASLQDDSALGALSDLGQEGADMTAVKRDAEIINRACGLPGSYHLGNLAVPSAAGE